MLFVMYTSLNLNQISLVYWNELKPMAAWKEIKLKPCGMLWNAVGSNVMYAVFVVNGL